MIVGPCFRCRQPIEHDSFVRLNGMAVHVVTCFEGALAEYKLGDVEVELSPAMDPLVAYRAGKTFAAVMLERSS